jgi:hypothetical protein
MLGGGALDDFFTQQLGTLPSRTNTLNWQALQLHRHESQEGIHQAIMPPPRKKPASLAFLQGVLGHN